jgi:hypothetical protein
MCIAALAFVFPLLLVGIGYYFHEIPFQQSLSHYYFAFVPETSDLRVFPMRGFFVGILWAIGIFLILYRGFSTTETWLLNIAGFSAIAVALIPMEVLPYCSHCGADDWSAWHYRFAVALFILIGLVALVCNEDTLKELKKEHERQESEIESELLKLKEEHTNENGFSEKGLHELKDRHRRLGGNFRKVYYVLAAVMILGPLTAWGISYLGGMHGWYKLLAVEWAGIWAFAAYWAVKSYEVSLSKADEKAVMGKMTSTDPTVKLTNELLARGSRLLNRREGAPPTAR